jgi:hypothetical protein
MPEFAPQNENEGVARSEGGRVSAIPTYPTLFKHMVLAIFLGKDLPRSRPPKSKNRIPVRSSPNKDSFDPTKFNAAMDIALAQLKKYGMILEKSSRLQIFLTSRGRERDAAHRIEPGARTKNAKFDKLYEALLVEGKKRVPKPMYRPGAR